MDWQKWYESHFSRHRVERKMRAIADFVQSREFTPAEWEDIEYVAVEIVKYSSVKSMLINLKGNLSQNVQPWEMVIDRGLRSTYRFREGFLEWLYDGNIPWEDQKVIAESNTQSSAIATTSDHEEGGVVHTDCEEEGVVEISETVSRAPDTEVHAFVRDRLQVGISDIARAMPHFQEIVDSARSLISFERELSVISEAHESVEGAFQEFDDVETALVFRYEQLVKQLEKVTHELNVASKELLVVKTARTDLRRRVEDITQSVSDLQKRMQPIIAILKHIDELEATRAQFSDMEYEVVKQHYGSQEG